jgi:hypothetical protein
MIRSLRWSWNMEARIRRGGREPGCLNWFMFLRALRCGRIRKFFQSGRFNNRRSTGIKISCNRVIFGLWRISLIYRMIVRPYIPSRDSPFFFLFLCFVALVLMLLARATSQPKEIKQLPFLTKYLELQRAMFYHNNALTSSHPYASFPISWPFLLRGVSFWTKGDEVRQQIYFLGNPVGWWIAVGFLAVFTGIISADQVTRRRGVESIEERNFPSPTPVFSSRTHLCRISLTWHSCPRSFIQLNWLLLLRMGSPLFPFLHYGPSTFPAPLPSCAPSLFPRRRRTNPIPLLPRVRWPRITRRRHRRPHVPPHVCRETESVAGCAKVAWEDGGAETTAS